MAVPNIFGSVTAAIPLSQLDTNFATAITLGNTAVVLGNTYSTISNLTLTNVTISSGTSNISTNVSTVTGTLPVANGGTGSTTGVRSYLAGLTMSTAGASATMSIAAGSAMDSTNSAMMVLAAIAKTTSAWAVGTAQGGLDTGAIANSTWYHFYVIQRVDTSVVDVVFSTNATTPTLPTNYTLYRRIGSMKTNGSAQWASFVQDGDYFQWASVIADISASNPGTAAVTRTMSVPLGIRCLGVFHPDISVSSDVNFYLLLLSDLSTTDDVSSTSTANSGIPFMTALGGAMGANGYVQVMSNTSSQIRSRLNASTANLSLLIGTRGWFDSRGRNA